MRVMVIGAGVGGLTLAQGLRRAGIDVVVYERDGVRGRPQGVSLHLDDRAMTALRECLAPARLAEAEGAMGALRDNTLLVSEVDGRFEVVGTRPGRARPGRQTHRPLLRAALLTGLEVRFGARFTRFRADGTVRAWFADGSSDIADVLVGADGIGSAVRRCYLPDVPVVDTGMRMLMGATPLRAVAGTGLPELIGDNAAAVQAGELSMALGVLRFPCPHVDIEDYLMWALPGSADVANPTLRQVVDAAWSHLTATLRIGTIPLPPPWLPTPVTLIGDAIHAAPGFGANLAMQDASRLCAALTRVAAGDEDLLGAIGAYERELRGTRFRPGTAPGKRPEGDLRDAQRPRGDLHGLA